MPAWRAIQTKPQLEGTAAASLNALDLPVFYPRRMARLHVRGSPRVEKPFFPSYIFSDVGGHHLHEVMRARGVHSVIGTMPIPTVVMTELMARADPSGLIVEPWRIGKTYQLQEPRYLANALVRLESIDGHNRARVLIRILGLDRPVTVSLSNLSEAV